MWRFSFIIFLLFFVNQGFADSSVKSKYNVSEGITLDGGKAETYIVKKGDTLYRIAKAHNTTVKELRKLNRLDRSVIKEGQRLLLHLSNRNTGSEGNLEHPDKRDSLLLFAKKFLNIPYRFGGSSIFGIDCSAYVQKVFDFLGISLPRTAREQFNIGDDVDREDLTIGDLVFFRAYAKFPSHVGIYIGDNLFIHASSKDRRVKINNLNEPYYFKRFLGARRLIESEVEGELEVKIAQ